MYKLKNIMPIAILIDNREGHELCGTVLRPGEEVICRSGIIDKVISMLITTGKVEFTYLEETKEPEVKSKSRWDFV